MIDIELELTLKELQDEGFSTKSEEILNHWQHQEHVNLSPASSELSTSQIALLGLLKERYTQVFTDFENQLKSEIELKFEADANRNKPIQLKSRALPSAIYLNDFDLDLKWAFQFDLPDPELGFHRAAVVHMSKWNFQFIEFKRLS